MRSAFLVRDNIRHRRDIEDAYLHAIEQAQFEIILANAYFLPGLNFRHALLDASGRGVRVVLLLPCTGKMLIAVSEKYKIDRTKTVFIMAKWTI